MITDRLINRSARSADELVEITKESIQERQSEGPVNARAQDENNILAHFVFRRT